VRVHQLGHGLIPGDAISHHVLEIDRRMQAWGFETTIFAGHVHPEYRSLAQDDERFSAYLHAADDLLFYHYSIYDLNYRLFRSFKGRKVLIYHNITPARFFRKWDASLAALCDTGRRILPELRDCDLALGDSDFNRRELLDLGFDPGRSGVLPVFLSQESFEQTPANPTLLEQLRRSGGANLLSVGRIVPSKAVEDLIRIFYVYHGAIDPLAHLYLVGSRYVAAYDEQLDALLAALGLQDHVTFTGLVPGADLKAYYQAADVYLHASRHEGFCVPLVESMYFGVPILARKAAAVPETLGDAGILFTRLGYEQVAEMVHVLTTDRTLRAQVIARQRERLGEFCPARVETRLREVLARLDIRPPQETRVHA
jgi:glycosyltransferase involved in cell wall biosynthesis